MAILIRPRQDLRDYVGEVEGVAHAGLAVLVVPWRPGDYTTHDTT